MCIYIYICIDDHCNGDIVWTSIILSRYYRVCLTFFLSPVLSLLIYLSTHLPIYLSTFLPIYLPIHLSIDLSEHQLRKWVGKWREWRRKGASTHWNAMYITSHSSCHFPCFPCVPHGFTAWLCASKLLASIHADENAWCQWGFTRGSPTDFVTFIWQTLVGGIPTPLKNMNMSVGMMTFSIYGKS